jgi:NADPH:quinone reductase-like Zn-dependent oxidoreductase
MREGLWGEVAKVSGIECVGIVKADPDGKFAGGQTVAAMMGGLGRTINGSYAQYTRVPLTNVVAFQSQLPWEDLAAIPEVYATAWTALFANMELKSGQTLLVRGATSALGQAAVNIAAHAGTHVIATTRNPERLSTLKALRAEQALLDAPDLSGQVRELYPNGIDAVLDLVGNTTLLDSLNMVRRNGRVCEAGFLGGLGPIESFNPIRQVPSGVQFSSFWQLCVWLAGFSPLGHSIPDHFRPCRRWFLSCEAGKDVPFRGDSGCTSSDRLESGERQDRRDVELTNSNQANHHPLARNACIHAQQANSKGVKNGRHSSWL